MAADGTVNIDVVLNSEQVQQKAKDIDNTLTNMGEKAGEKAKESVEKNANESTEKVKNAHEKMKQDTSDPVTQKVKADTGEATEKVNEYKKQTVKIPKDVRTKLIAEAKDQGIENFDKLLKKLPKKQLTQLIAQVKNGEVINYEKELQKVPAKLITQVKLNDNASAGLQKLRSEAEQTGSSFSHLKEIIAGSFVGSVAARGLGMIGGYLQDTVHEAMDASDAINKFKSTMQLGGFGEKEINSASKEVQKYANETVYELGDVSNTTAQLASNGIKNYMQLTEAAGNLNAQAGGTAETFKSVAMVMTQTAGEGKLTAENWNQLIDAIPGASGKLQEAMKKNGAYTGNFRDAMSKGEITADEFNKAMMQLGMNDGAKKAAKSTETFEGAFGNLRAQVVTGLQEMIEKIGKRRMTDIINTLTDAVLGLTNLTLKFFTVIAEHKQIAVGLGAVLAGVFATKKIVDFIAYLGKAKTALMEFGLVEKLFGGGSSPVPSTPRVPTSGGAGATIGSNLARFGGRAVPVAAATFAVGSELVSNHSTSEKVGGSAGAIAGAVGGRALGGAIGTMIAPGIGTAVGQMLGGSVGTWVGNKFGDTIGKAVNKRLQGKSIVTHTKVKIDSETSGTSKAIRPDLNKITRQVIKMSVDPKSIADTKQKTDALYKDMSKQVQKYYSDKEKKSQKDLQQLVKEGAITQQQANQSLQKLKDSDNKKIKESQAALDKMKKSTDQHYRNLQNIQNGGTKKLLAIEQKYGRNSKKYNDERIREIQKENKRYAKQLVKDQMSADKSIQASLKKGTKQQEKIYKDLIKQKGKLSLQDLKQTQRDANKQYQATVRPAKKARDEAVRAAKNKYNETVKAAENEYKKTHSISKKQYQEIVKNAKKQRDDTVNAANDQYRDVTKKASDQHDKVTKEINAQKDDAIAATQAQMQGINGSYSTGFSASGKTWNKFLDGVKKVLKFFAQNTNNVPAVPTGYAKGTGALKRSQLAMVGEEGFELAHTPTGYELFGANGPELRYLPAGTSILTHDQSKVAMAMNGGKLPGYAKGTGAKIADFVDSVEDGFEDAFDLIGKAAGEIWDWLKKKTGLDSMLDAQKSMGGVKRATRGSFEYGKDAIGKYIKKMADKFLESFSGGSVSSKLIKVAAAMMHESVSASDISRIMNVIQHESGGSATVVNNWDSNAAAGTPSKGILQFIDPTFMHYAMPGHTNILNPLDQLLAMFNDTTWRSDLTLGGWGPSGGRKYANGGWADRLSIFGEVKGQPEVAINPARDSSEEHIAEAIEARAKVNPNGFAGSISNLIKVAQDASQNLVPITSNARGSRKLIGNTAPSRNIDGNVKIYVNVDGRTIGQAAYPTIKALRSHEMIVQNAGGAIPVGNARPLGGGF